MYANVEVKKCFAFYNEEAQKQIHFTKGIGLNSGFYNNTQGQENLNNDFNILSRSIKRGDEITNRNTILTLVLNRIGQLMLYKNDAKYLQRKCIVSF